MKAVLAFCLLALFLGAQAQLTPYITSHFKTWLNANGYSSFNFERKEIAGGSYGGKTSDDDQITREPVIFFHGNSDRAVGKNDDFNGFTDSINYFLSQGYKSSELYITTWGPANPALSSQQFHSYTYVNYLRKFTEAVLAYTNASKVDVIGHSMGVTLGRKVLRGGQIVDNKKTYDIGPSLISRVDTFLGIAGANLGLVTCAMLYSIPTCNKETGFFPGAAAKQAASTYLQELRTVSMKEGDYLFSMLSTADDLIQYGDKVYGEYTSQIPNENDSKIYTNLGHMALKRQTSALQLQIITQHKI